jgi:hypothetical protein
MTAACAYRPAARLRLSGLATTRFHRFTACGAMPSHLAPQFDRKTITLPQLSGVVRHSKIGCSTSDMGQKRTMATDQVNVRFTPNSGHERRHRNVSFGPKGDIGREEIRVGLSGRAARLQPRADHWIAPPKLSKGRRKICCDNTEGITLTEKKRAEFGLANPSCTIQHGLKHWLQFAGR